MIGFTNYHRKGNVVSIDYHLKNAVPNATYRVELWGNVCQPFGVVETVTTNSNGVANANPNSNADGNGKGNGKS